MKTVKRHSKSISLGENYRFPEGVRIPRGATLAFCCAGLTNNLERPADDRITVDGQASANEFQIQAHKVSPTASANGTATTIKFTDHLSQNGVPSDGKNSISAPAP